jgi:dipeptidyl aminopeptidase/acylaminoacyl peptidase
MYFSTTANLYAKPNPLTGQWEYQSAGETSAAGAANASKAFEEDRSVGWAMLGDRDDRDGGDDDKDVAIQRDQGSTAYNDPVAYAYPADATAGFLAHPKIIASSQVEVSAAVAPKTTQILRLVVVKSRILRDSERVAVIDSREDGFIIGRDKNHRPRIRLKEMEVSKVHATVFWGDGKGSLDDEEGDEGYWLVDNGESVSPRWLRRTPSPVPNPSTPPHPRINPRHLPSRPAADRRRTPSVGTQADLSSQPPAPPLPDPHRQHDV